MTSAPTPMVAVHRVAASGPDDVSGLTRLVDSGALDPAGIVAILGKTEGNGCVNDFSRGFATQSLGLFLRDHVGAEAAAEVCLVMSGGTEGALSPHWIVFERKSAGQLSSSGSALAPSLAMGSAITPPLPPEHLGRLAQVGMVAQGVRDAMGRARINDPSAVHFVQIKCPLLTSARVAEAEARGHATTTRDTLKSMGLSRGASALGVAVALGELPLDVISETAIGTDMGLWSGRASTSSGIEIMGHEILVLGMSPDWTGPLAIDHAVMADAADVEPVRAALDRLGLGQPGQLDAAARGRVRTVLAKAEASRTGTVRGLRHTMLDDSDISATRHARAFVAGVLAGATGMTDLFVSGGAEHQGPDGGGPVAIIVERA
ncbi:cyanuric acid amidohydrolase [Skermanella stibiiresistens SB22]|uniref:Cyanuric acid amidohydrolase n=1 Tax=Skermanella stibiiresistens SB22 TaxID=1385369 RepID=W9HCZ7_9PROT|nr:ring-opening amidohydrolase [Skermanella stibiiresistens]EWY42582.1 cyanuric acid amidohydrolase [Skermanella stibiiresistens SB22]